MRFEQTEPVYAWECDMCKGAKSAPVQGKEFPAGWQMLGHAKEGDPTREIREMYSVCPVCWGDFRSFVQAQRA